MRVRMLGGALALLLAVGGWREAAACRDYPQPALPTVSLPLITGAARTTLRVELARTPEQKNCGLMGRTELPADGMLFDMRPAGPAHFWMQNTPLSLDLVFIAPDGGVAHIERAARPFSTDALGTDDDVAAVLEVPAGDAARLGIGPGAQFVLPWRRR